MTYVYFFFKIKTERYKIYSWLKKLPLNRGLIFQIARGPRLAN